MLITGLRWVWQRRVEVHLNYLSLSGSEFDLVLVVMITVSKDRDKDLEKRLKMITLREHALMFLLSISWSTAKIWPYWQNTKIMSLLTCYNLANGQKICQESFCVRIYFTDHTVSSMTNSLSHWQIMISCQSSHTWEIKQDWTLYEITLNWKKRPV